MADGSIYFVSDTHLGDGTGADIFMYPAQLIDLLHRIDAEPGAQLVLLGDLMELWATSLEPVLIRHAPVFYLLGGLAANHSVTYVVGNHDCLPWYYFIGQAAGNIKVVDRFTAARGTLVAVHGHQFDPLNRIKITDGHVKVPWTRRLVEVLGLVGRLGGSATVEALINVGDTLEHMADSLEQLLRNEGDNASEQLHGFLANMQKVLERESPGERGYPFGEEAYETGARSLMRGGARFVVMGHTHHPLLRQYGNRTYANSGSWVWQKYPPTYVRFANNRLELLDATTHQPYIPK